MAKERIKILDDIIQEELGKNPKTAAFAEAIKAGDHAKALGILNSTHALRLLNDVLDANYTPTPHKCFYQNGNWVVARFLPAENGKWFAGSIKERLGVDVDVTESKNSYGGPNPSQVNLEINPLQENVLQNLLYDKAKNLLIAMHNAVANSEEHLTILRNNREAIVRPLVHRLVDEYVSGKVAPSLDHPAIAELYDLENQRIASEQAMAGSDAEFRVIAEQRRAQLEEELKALPQAKAFHANKQAMADLDGKKAKLVAATGVLKFVTKKLEAAGIKPPIQPDSKAATLKVICSSGRQESKLKETLHELGIDDSVIRYDYHGIGVISSKYEYTISLNSPKTVESIIKTEIDKRIKQRSAGKDTGNSSTLSQVVTREVLGEVIGFSIGAAVASR